MSRSSQTAASIRRLIRRVTKAVPSLKKISASLSIGAELPPGAVIAQARRHSDLSASLSGSDNHSTEPVLLSLLRLNSYKFIVKPAFLAWTFAAIFRSTFSLLQAANTVSEIVRISLFVFSAWDDLYRGITMILRTAVDYTDSHDHVRKGRRAGSTLQLLKILPLLRYGIFWARVSQDLKLTYGNSILEQLYLRQYVASADYGLSFSRDSQRGFFQEIERIPAKAILVLFQMGKFAEVLEMLDLVGIPTLDSPFVLFGAAQEKNK